MALCLLLGACVPPEPPDSPRRVVRPSDSTPIIERPALGATDPSLRLHRVARLLPRTTYFFAVRRSVTCGARDLANFKPIQVVRRPGPASNLLWMALSVGLDRFTRDMRPLADPPPPWLLDVTIEDRVAVIDYARPLAKKIPPHCGASIWFNEVIRTAFQFPSVDNVRILFGGRCDTGPFEGDPRPCTGFKRDVFEHPRAWGPIPHVSLPPGPREGEIVFYEADCGFPFPNYRIQEVRIAANEEAVLTPAVNALLRYWYRSEPRLAARSSRWVDVSISDGIAIFDWQSLQHLGWASTSCGGVGFGQSMDRTALQFATVEAVQHWYRGSCGRFSAWAQGSGCQSVGLNAHDQLVRLGT